MSRGYPGFLLDASPHRTTNPDQEYDRSTMVSKFALRPAHQREADLDQLYQLVTVPDMTLRERSKLNADYTFLKNAHLKMKQAGR